MAVELKFGNDNDTDLDISVFQGVRNILDHESLNIDFREDRDQVRRITCLQSIFDFLGSLDEPTRVHTHPGLKVRIGLHEPIEPPHAMDFPSMLFPTLAQVRWISELVIDARNTLPDTFATAMWLMESAPCAFVKRLTLFLSPQEQIDFDQLSTYLSIYPPPKEQATHFFTTLGKELELRIQKDDDFHSSEAVSSAPILWTPKLHRLSLGIKSLHVGKGIRVGLEIFGQTSTDGNTTEWPFLEMLTMDCDRCVFDALSSSEVKFKSIAEPDSARYNLGLAQELEWVAAAAAAQNMPKLKAMNLSSPNPAIPDFYFTCETEGEPAQLHARIFWRESMFEDAAWKPSHKVLSAWHAVARKKGYSELGVHILEDRTRRCTSGTFPTAAGEPSSFDFEPLETAAPEQQL